MKHLDSQSAESGVVVLRRLPEVLDWQQGRIQSDVGTHEETASSHVRVIIWQVFTCDEALLQVRHKALFVRLRRQYVILAKATYLSCIQGLFSLGRQCKEPFRTCGDGLLEFVRSAMSGDLKEAGGETSGARILNDDLCKGLLEPQ